MPVDHRLKKDEIVYQRDLYSKSLITRTFRDFLDRKALEIIEESENILEVGCGEGLLLEKIVRMKKNALVCGVDLSLENVDICLSHNLPAVLADAKRLPFADGMFDACIMAEVIEHLEKGDPQKVIREIARVLKKNGKLFLMFPNDRNYKISRLLVFKFKEAFYNMGHTKQWKPQEVLDLLEDASFFIYKSFSVPINNWHFSSDHIVIGVKK